MNSGVTFRKKYRSVKVAGQVALISSFRTRRIKKSQVRDFISYHFPQATKYKIRLLNQYKKGCIALISSADKKPLWTV